MLSLGTIPEEFYSDYRYKVIFKGYKWDPQVEDHNTIAKNVVLMDQNTVEELENWAEKLAFETVQMEEALLKNPHLIKTLTLPKTIRKALSKIDHYDSSNHVRLMRFDFHPTPTGWAISEVNSDVPGGLAEASILPQLAQPYFPEYAPGENTGKHLLSAFRKRAKTNGKIAFVHATSYADDRQVMQFLGDSFEDAGYHPVYASPDLIHWEHQQAVSLIHNEECSIDGILRFFPLEWMSNFPRKTDWKGYYTTKTPSCNHPIAMLTQSKRLPLVWDQLGIDLSTWKKLLPETKPVQKNKLEDGWIYKPALGRVGSGITISEAIPSKELKLIYKAVRKHPNEWVAQKRFESQPIADADGTEYHLCLGVFTVDGKAAGFYGRISSYARIDENAKDIPVLIERKK